MNPYANMTTEQIVSTINGMRDLENRLDEAKRNYDVAQKHLFAVMSQVPEALDECDDVSGHNERLDEAHATYQRAKFDLEVVCLECELLRGEAKRNADKA